MRRPDASANAGRTATTAFCRLAMLNQDAVKESAAHPHLPLPETRDALKMSAYAASVNAPNQVSRCSDPR
jgi:hypothetical protein